MKILYTGVIGVFLLTGMIAGSASAQCNGDTAVGGLNWEFEPEEESFSIGGFLGGLFTPQLVKDTRRIRRYVMDPRFAALMELCGDWRAVDAIYLKALKIAEYNVGRSLFLSMMATIEHQNMKIDMPIVGDVGVPLTFEPDSLFVVRLANLPGRLYADSPPTAAGDRDKLQHFFGSAYLAYASESPEVARSTGNVIEWGEARFIVGGEDDPRDRRANLQGETFGHDLLFVNNLLPSDYLKLPVEPERE